ncbi:T6SS effector BTH_I2691 family protein [Paraburkholderia sp. J67]|uniref:T6SS effector BTH_I2691 family protein n=1 Tax=Paraburkholderia sp. J67 TaxID=2805435 RepID=UPI002ABD4F1B|nr:T6SS effector BTH_I2691 family protein [Paraburkholderia sp. J67]
MAGNDDRCDVCKLKGLAVYMARYTVVPKTFNAPALGPFSADKVKQVSIGENKYALRQLRQGFVYLFYEKGPRGNHYWEVYAVAADGTLTRQLDPAAAKPVDEPQACSRSGHSALRLLYVVIEKPQECGKVWFAFAERAWSDDTVKRYAGSDELRNRRMQAIEPAKWIASPTPGSHTAPLNAANVQHVIEYAGGLGETPKECTALPYEFRPPVSNEARGAFHDNVVEMCTTRYPWAIRQGWWNGHATAQLVEQAQSNSFSDAAGKEHCAPMMLALWDAVGITHELNGFRNDPVAWLNQYALERALQVTALSDIDTAKTTVEKGAVNREAQFQSEVGQASTAGLKDSAASLRQQAATMQAGAERTRALETADDYDYLAQNGLGGPYVAQVQSFGSEAERQAWRTKTDAEIAQINKTKQQRLSDARTNAWPRYENRLKRADIDYFRGRYAAIQEKVRLLQEKRTDDIAAWLGAQPWLDALEDCHDANFIDGLKYEVTVGTALFGLDSTPKGAAKVDSLVAMLDASKPESIVWRSIAMNQKDARIEITQALQSADSKKETPLQGNVEAVAAVMAQIKSVVGYYKKLSDLALESDAKKITPIGSLLKALQVDQLVMTTGDSIFRRFRINKAADFVGEKIIQSIFLQRSGISDYDALALVRKQAELEGLSRKEILGTLKVAHGFIKGEEALGGLGKQSRTQALVQAWGQIKDTEDGAKALRSARITLVSGLLEAVNFYKLMVMPSDDNTKLNLVSSGMSLCSAVIDIGMAPFYAALKNSTRSQAWKLTGGALGTLGAMIGAWMDAAKAGSAFSKQQYTIAILTSVKAATGAAAGISVFISAIGKSGLLLRRVAARFGTEAIVGLVEAATERALAFAALRGIGMLLGWEATVGLLVVQGLIWYFTPNALESWCARCAFGTGREKDFFVDHDVQRYTDKDIKLQVTEFSTSLAAVQ